jgi:hypothetical protein
LVVSRCKFQPATGSLQPIAIEAARGGNETVGAVGLIHPLEPARWRIDWQCGDPTATSVREVTGRHAAGPGVEFENMVRVVAQAGIAVNRRLELPRPIKDRLDTYRWARPVSRNPEGERNFREHPKE